MSYSTISEVRKELGLDDFHPADATITEFITKSDREVDSILLDDASRYSEKIIYLGDGTFISLSKTASEIISLYVSGEEFKEYEEDDMLDDGNVEESTNSDPEYWNKSEASGDTLTWATDYSYNLYRSLKITKGTSSESSWYSDDVEEVAEEKVYEARARIKVDSNTSGSVYLRLAFYDSDDNNLVNYDSPAVSIQITQPTSASTISAVSSSSSDTTQKLIIEGTVNGLEDFEIISLNGTTSVSSSKSFSYIKGLRLDASCSGTITVTSNGGAVTNASFSSGDLEKNDWQEIKISGSTPHDVAYARVYLRCNSSSGSCWGDAFRLYARNWKFYPVDKKIEFYNRVIQDGELIEVTYLRTQDSELVKNLSTCLAALRCLVWLSGADTDADYNNLKLGGYAPVSLKNRFNYLTDKINFLVRQIRDYDFKNPDFILGHFK